MRKGYLVTAVVLYLWVIAFSTGVNASATKSDTFSVQIDTLGAATGGDGSGFNNGAWYTYPTTDTYAWHSQWFNDQPFHPNGTTTINATIHIKQIDTNADYYFEFGINWSTPSWTSLGYGDALTPIPSDQGGDPNFDENEHLVRQKIFTTYGAASNPLDFTLILERFPINDYSPEWISVDVRGSNIWLDEGNIDHTSTVPVPGAIWLLGSGIIGLMAFQKRNTFKR